MLDFFNLIRALNTDQYDDLTVKELKEKFNTEPDIDTTHVVLAPEGLNERRGMSIMANAAFYTQGKCVILVGGNPDTDPFDAKPDKPFIIENLKIEPICESAHIFDNPKRIREERKQNQYRSRHHKK